LLTSADNSVITDPKFEEDEVSDEDDQEELSEKVNDTLLMVKELTNLIQSLMT